MTYTAHITWYQDDAETEVGYGASEYDSLSDAKEDLLNEFNSDSSVFNIWVTKGLHDLVFDQKR